MTIWPTVYQLIKFQVLSSNCFRDILLTSLLCPNLQRTINSWNIWQNLFKSYSGNLSSLISWPSIKPLVQIIFWDIVLTRFHSFFQIGITPERDSDKKKIWVSYFSMRNPYMKFQNPSMNTSYDMACIKKHDKRNHRHTDRHPESNMPLQLLSKLILSNCTPLHRYFHVGVNYM